MAALSRKKLPFRQGAANDGVEPKCMYRLLFASEILAWLAVVADMYPACSSARGPWPFWVTHAP